MRIAAQLAFLLLYPAILLAQPVWVEHLIDQDYTFARMAQSCDMDGDGDLDLVIAGEGLFWFENLNGEATEWQRHQIVEYFSISALTLADFDGDGDVDIAGARGDGTPPILLRNTDGSGTVWQYQILYQPPPPRSFMEAYEFVSGDYDDDGDIDIISAHADENSWTFEIFERVTILENSGDGSEWWPNPLNVPDREYWTRHVDLADMDGDGDLDIMSGQAFNHWNHELVWWENPDWGNPWTSHLIGSDSTTYRDALTADVDDNGTMDVIYSQWEGDAPDVYVSKNVDGSGDNWSTEILATDKFKCDVADFFQDGIEDVLALSIEDSSLVLYCWEGGQWIDLEIVPGFQGAYDFYTVDIDMDDDLDVVLLRFVYSTPQLTWWENPGVSGVEETAAENGLPHRPQLLSVYPNPFNGLARARLNVPVPSELSLTLYDILGQAVHQVPGRMYSSGMHEIAVDASGLASGTYYLQVVAEGEPVQTQRLILLQ